MVTKTLCVLQKSQTRLEWHEGI